MVKPEFDVHELARVLLTLAAEDIKNQRAAADGEPPAA